MKLHHIMTIFQYSQWIVCLSCKINCNIKNIDDDNIYYVQIDGHKFLIVNSFIHSKVVNLIVFNDCMIVKCHKHKLKKKSYQLKKFKLITFNRREKNSWRKKQTILFKKNNKITNAYRILNNTRKYCKNKIEYA